MPGLAHFAQLPQHPEVSELSKLLRIPKIHPTPFYVHGNSRGVGGDCLAYQRFDDRPGKVGSEAFVGIGTP
jgi:hypothetical protein